MNAPQTQAQPSHQPDPPRVYRCLKCSQPITGDGYTVPAVNPYVDETGAVHAYRAAYHVPCAPQWVRDLAARLPAVAQDA